MRLTAWSRSSKESLRPVTDDAGTVIGDRPYRPDVEGLRAVAVVVVICFHAQLLGLTGGFVGVDVFYVISGFVITGVLLRHYETRNSVSFGDFYGRRSRRILPAAGLVLIVTILASYHWLGFIRGAEIADDARWSAVFLANFHFAAAGTNYLLSQLPPSPLQNYWSLGVEEQFYLVYPVAMALCLFAFSKVSSRNRVVILTSTVVFVSLGWCIYQTSTNPSVAYFSSLTRAWELALGGLVAAGTSFWIKIPRTAGAVMTWLGAAGILIAVTQYSTAIVYPGWAALLPVVSAAMIIAGGMSAGKWGVELVLGTAVFRAVGKLSFSLYLWAWPILTIATESAQKSLDTWSRVLTVLMALILSIVTYSLVENPIRHSGFLSRRWWRSTMLGGLIVAAVLIVATIEIHTAHTI